MTDIEAITPTPEQVHLRLNGDSFTVGLGLVVPLLHSWADHMIDQGDDKGDFRSVHIAFSGALILMVPKLRKAVEEMRNAPNNGPFEALPSYGKVPRHYDQLRYMIHWMIDAFKNVLAFGEWNIELAGTTDGQGNISLALQSFDWVPADVAGARRDAERTKLLSQPVG